MIRDGTLFSNASKSICYTVLCSLLLSLFQPPVDYPKLMEMGERKIQQCGKLLGICCADNKLYCVQKRGDDHRGCSLCMYHIEGDSQMSLMCSADLEDPPLIKFCHPNVDRASQYVYLPHGIWGLWVFRYDPGLNRLLEVKILKCAKEAVSVAVKSRDSLLVCDTLDRRVCVVRVSTDTVVTKLQPTGEPPTHVSVTADSVLVCYGIRKLIIYRRSTLTPERLLERPGDLRRVFGITTDCYSSFLLSDPTINTVFVLDHRGTLRQTVHTDHQGVLGGCAVVQKGLWLCYDNGSVVVWRPTGL